MATVEAERMATVIIYRRLVVPSFFPYSSSAYYTWVDWYLIELDFLTIVYAAKVVGGEKDQWCSIGLGTWPICSFSWLFSYNRRFTTGVNSYIVSGSIEPIQSIRCIPLV